ncbi:hypothetical protein C8Q74DRAFT_1365284 [Fomes fomentarius]|nr:hypothetical protein C8Q74DRAFT_1365284 [Fomes fomentarius]
MTPPRKKVKTNHRLSNTTGAGLERVPLRPPLPRRQQLSTEHLSASREAPDLSFDVLGEIFKLLHPRDLLNVARTSKNISRFVLHRNQEYIWRHGRERTRGIPKCPSFLSERVFAHFLFSPFCHGCGESQGVKAVWTWYARYCSKCLAKAQYVGSDAIAAFYGIGEYISDNEDWKQLFNVLDPDVDVFKAKKNRIQRRQLDEFARKWQAADTAEVQCLLIKRQKAVVKERAKFATVCEDFCAEQVKVQSRQKAAATKARNKVILARLCAAGYGSEIDELRKSKKLSSFLQHSTVVCVESVADPTGDVSEKMFEDLKNTLELTRRLL